MSGLTSPSSPNYTDRKKRDLNETRIFQIDGQDIYCTPEKVSSNKIEIFYWLIFPKVSFLVMAATMTFLPSFLMAIISTLDLNSKKSLSILISHPYLVLLPTFNQVFYSKLQICGDRLTLINMVLNTVVVCGIIIVPRFRGVGWWIS